MKKTLLALLCTLTLAGCWNPLGSDPVDLNGDGVISQEEKAAAKPESPWVGLAETGLELAGAAGVPLVGYLALLWRRQKGNVRALVAGGEAVQKAVALGGPLSVETVKALMREGQARYGAGEALFKEISAIKDQIRAAK